MNIMLRRLWWPSGFWQASGIRLSWLPDSFIILAHLIYDRLHRFSVLLSYDRLLRLWQASQVLNHLRNNRLQRLCHSHGLHRQVSQVLSLFWLIRGVTGPKVMLFFCLIFGIAGCKGQFFLLVCVLAGFTGYVPLRSHLIYYKLQGSIFSMSDLR